MHHPVRLLTAVPLCDGHDSAVTTINTEFVRHGIEVVYLGFHRSVSDIARAAVQEDVAAAGISSYNGGHVEFFREVRHDLDRRGGRRIGLFGGGGGTISPDDARRMRKQGTDEVFFAGTPLPDIVRYVQRKYARRGLKMSGRDADSWLAARLSSIESRQHGPKAVLPNRLERDGPPVIGITGPGGAGKTTLIDELVLRFLEAHPRGRVAILSHDPSLPGEGALLGDRAMMIHSQDDRVFMRSLATRGSPGGLAAATQGCLSVLRRASFDLILVETVGTGQEAMPFQAGLFDRSVLVMNPDYGAPLQLQKVVMLVAADVVVVNKADQPRARAAMAEIGLRLEAIGRGQQLVSTEAQRHRDPGVDRLFGILMEAVP